MRETTEAILARIADQVRACTICPLHATREHAVPGEGRADALVAFIGEAPGAEEDKQGRPSSAARASSCARPSARSAGARGSLYRNVLKCRPPDNRDPLDHEIAACQHYLMAQLALIRPRLIVTLGRYSMNLLIDPQLKITRVRGQHNREGRHALPADLPPQRDPAQ